MKIIFTLSLILLIAALTGAPVVSNLIVCQRNDDSKLLDIYFSIENDTSVTVTVLASADNGSTWTMSCTQVSGDVGSNISPGAGKHIIWDVLTEHPSISGDYFRIKITAYDGNIPPIPQNFIFVDGGTFHNGVSYVTLSSFFMDKYELTQSGFQSIMGYNPSVEYGVGDNYPVYNVSWFNAIEYCNRRSIAEDLSPCYSYSTYGADPNNWPVDWDTNYTNHTNVNCDWSQNGYRLPSEMEWVFAAKGGNYSQGYIYSGGNIVDDVAWHSLNSGNLSHIVGTKAPNELGFYDMSGNVWEWLWDRYGPYPTSPQTNPTGPLTGSRRGYRGGSYADNWVWSQIDERPDGLIATTSARVLGLRICRIVP